MDNRLITDITTHVVMLSTGSHRFITENTNEVLKRADINDFISLPHNNGFKVAAIMEILTVGEFYTMHPDKVKKDYHQPYSKPKNLPPLGRLTKDQQDALLLKGFRKVKPKATLKDIKSPYVKTPYTAKYKTWEDAKAAGVV